MRWNELEIPHVTSTSHCAETDGIIERAVRRITEGTSCSLFQSGFNDLWWRQAVYCYCLLRNVFDILAGSLTAWHKRFGEAFSGPITPFGAEVRYKPISKEDKMRLPKYGDKLLPGIFVGYHQRSGGGWTGDLLVIDQEEIDTADFRSEIIIKRLKASEVHVITTTSSAEGASSAGAVGNDVVYHFPMLEYDLNQPGGRPPYVRSKRKRPPAVREHVPLAEQRSNGEIPDVDSTPLSYGSSRY